jgi:hypothetical protein
MAHNPYNAPSSTVQDPPFPIVPRPPEVTRACRILWAIFVLSFVTLHPAIRGRWWVIPNAEDIAPAFMISVSIVFAVVYAVLVWLTGRRRNWARWALLVFVVVTTLIAAGDLPRSFSETPIAAVADVCFTLAEVWAFRLIFSGRGAEWFRSA